MGRGRVSGRVRIIGGRWRGRRVTFPGTVGLRPTPDRVRETLFNWLSPYLAGARVLDLFAGSGILGFEALSRGASSVTAVENDRVVARSLKESASALDAQAFELRIGDAPAVLAPGTGPPFDIVFIDPPHADADYQALCDRLDASGLLRPNALIYVEFSKRRAPVFTPPASWERHRVAHAGDVEYGLWRYHLPSPD